MSDSREQAALLALVSRTTSPWYRVASLVEEAGGALRLAHGDYSALTMPAAGDAERFLPVVPTDEITHFTKQIQAWVDGGLRLVTVLDDDYPLNLREVYNRPPFLFVRGEVRAQDDRAVAVVGTRNPSVGGLRQARELTREFVEAGMTLVSGLAAGIDTAAHTAALDAGGRTLAVFGTGINRVYPPADRDLAARILTAGAQVSQFWPDAPPTKTSFPMRNVVLSGLAVGTVVVEAHGRSGASMQARLCLEHGKRLFLLRGIVEQEPWAQAYARRPGTVVVDTAQDVLEVVAEVLDPPGQLSLC